MPPRVRHIAFALFRQLLPLCGAVDHSGGIGTTAAALESACPQLVLPLAWDQPDNAARVAGLGAGLALGSRYRSSKPMTHSPAQLMTRQVGDRCPAVPPPVHATNGLEHPALVVG